MIIGMTIQATTRKMKRSFTLTPESVEFVTETRRKRQAGSDSEALDLLLRELMLEAKRQAIDAAYKEYYDTASDEELAEQSEWARMVGPNIMIDIDSSEAQL
jgi:hypothetical protein